VRSAHGRAEEVDELLQDLPRHVAIALANASAAPADAVEPVDPETASLLAFFQSHVDHLRDELSSADVSGAVFDGTIATADNKTKVSRADSFAASLRARPDMRFTAERFALLRQAGGDQGFHTGRENHNVLLAVAESSQRLSLRGLLRLRVQASAPKDGKDAGSLLYQRLARLLVDVEELAGLFEEPLRRVPLQLLCRTLDAERAGIASELAALRASAPLPLLSSEREWGHWFKVLCDTLGYTRHSVSAAAAAAWIERPAGRARTGAAAAVREYLHGAVGTMSMCLRGEPHDAASASLAALLAPACAQYLLDCDTQKHVVELRGNPCRRNDPALVSDAGMLRPVGDAATAVSVSFMRVLRMLPIFTARSALNSFRPSSAEPAAIYYAETMRLWEATRRGAIVGDSACVRRTKNTTEQMRGQSPPRLASVAGSATPGPPGDEKATAEARSLSADTTLPPTLLLPADSAPATSVDADSTDSPEFSDRETACTGRQAAAMRCKIAPFTTLDDLSGFVGGYWDMPAASVHDYFVGMVGCLPLEGDVEHAFRVPNLAAAT
jgi:hypothetical protein